MVLLDLNFTPPEEDDVHIPEGEHAGTHYLPDPKKTTSIYLKVN
jgi:hypothetical protein